MTRVWTEGFEMRDLVGYTHYGGVISTTVKRSGAASLAAFEYTFCSFTKTITAVSEFYLRIGIYLNSTEITVFQWKKGGTVLGTINISTAGITISCNGLTATGAYIPVVNTWFILEVHVKIDDAAGTVALKYEGTTDASVSGDTKPGADTTVDTLYFSRGGASYVTLYLDDMALNDTAGAVDNSWCGDGHITVIMPDDDSTPLQLTPSAAVHHHLLVDEVPADGDTTYVEGSVTDEEDIYGLAACGLVDVIITRIWTEARAEDTSSSGLKVALITKASGGSEVSGGDVVLTGTYTTKVLGAEQRVNPVDSAAWEVADIDALEGGVRTRN